MPKTAWKCVLKAKKNSDMEIYTQPYEKTGLNLLKGIWIFKGIEVDTLIDFMMNPDFE